MKNRMRQWAHNNAFMLIFLSVMFFITWTVEVIANVIL